MRSNAAKTFLWTAGLLIGSVVLALAAIGMGRFSMSLPQTIATLFPGALPDIEVTQTMRNVIFNIRLPRVLLSLLSGAGLSVAGASFQGLFSNPLATPDTLGVATGASFGAALGILLGCDMFMTQVCALLMGMLAVAIVYTVSRVRGGTNMVMIILGGMVVSSLFSALVSMIKYVADPQDVLPAITFWLMGSLSATNFQTLTLGAPFILVGTAMIFALRWRLNVLSLNEDEAHTLGVNVNLLRLLVILASTMITASVVSMCGLIGWVGLLIPHISRMLFGNDNRRVIPASIGLGAIFMLLIDTLARTVSASEIPVSILTAVIGAPVSTACAPRVRPSVELMAMQRTTLSPISCATSATSFLPFSSSSMALRRFGS